MSLNSRLIGIIILLSLSSSLVFADPNSEMDLFFNKGIKSLQAGILTEAISYFDKVLEIDPNHIGSLSNKGATLAQLGYADEAISYFDKVLEIDPNHLPALYTKGNILFKLDQLNASLIYFDKVLEIDPNHPDAIQKRYEIFQKQYVPISGSIQIQIYNIKNQLVGYIESDIIIMLDYYKVKQYLYGLPIKQSFISNGENFVLVELKDVNVMESPTTSAGVTYFFVKDKSSEFLALSAGHNGYYTEYGDKIISNWKILLPLS